MKDMTMRGRMWYLKKKKQEEEAEYFGINKS